MTALRAMLVTLGVALLVTLAVTLTGVGVAAIVLVAAWLIGNYGVDRMLNIVSVMIGVTHLTSYARHSGESRNPLPEAKVLNCVSPIMIGMAGVLFPLVLHFRPRRR